MSDIKLVIADDHPMMRDALGAVFGLEKEFAVQAVVSNGKEAYDACVKYLPDVLLTDVRMPDCDGFTALGRVKKGVPGVKVMLLAGMPLTDEMEKARAMGASAYLTKGLDRNRIIEAVRRVVTEKGVFVADNENPGTGSVLTIREMQVLKLLGVGLSSVEIAKKLKLSGETVRQYVKSLHIKLDAHSNAAAIATAFRLGILRT